MDAIIDSSVFVSIGLREPGYENLVLALGQLSNGYLSSVTAFETSMVLFGRNGVNGVRSFEALVGRLDLQIVPFDAIQATLALEAFRRFGKGQGHPARLNLGDCCAYALAKSRDLPLLFKGGDFGLTDVRIAAP